jgi:hypothetical protein
MGQPGKVNQILFQPLGVCCPYQFPMDAPGIKKAETQEEYKLMRNPDNSVVRHR